MPRLSLGLGVQTQRKVGGGAAIPTSGLSLWLKADSGLTTTPEQFISQIVLSDAGTPEVDGTYTRASGGTTSFSSSNGLSLDYIEFVDGSLRFEVLFEGDPMYIIDILYDEIVQISIVNGVSPAPTSSITLSPTGNTLVSAWADQSGNSNNAVGSDTLPTRQSNAINGYPAIRFNNTGENISKFTISNSFNLKNSSVFIVVKQLNIDNAFARMLALLGTSEDYDSDDGLAFLFNNTVPQLQLTSNLNDAIVDNLVAENVFASVSYKIDNIGDMSVFYNGVLGGTGGNFDMTSQNSGSLYIGQGSQNLTVAGLYGDIAEVILYNSNLTTPQRQQVEAYLNAKYAIY